MSGVEAAYLVYSNRRWLYWLVGIAVASVVVPMAMIASMASMQGASGSGGVGEFAPSAFALRDIPTGYLRTYQAAVGGGWEYLAAIGKIETDHGRSSAAGVRSGVNFAGCCAGPMLFSIVGAGGGTWGAYGHGGSVYDPAAAIPAAARYLQASGAPGDWDRALFAYNHASWYVAEVKAMAQRYRGVAIGAGGLPAGSSVSQGVLGRWLIPVPGTGATCDARIVPDLLMLMRVYHATPGDCYAASGHKSDGEHPLGLGVDLVPGQGGSWAMLGKLAGDLGWRTECAINGCAGSLPSPFRFIGYNGYPGHGDPQHVGADAHLHLSWMHTPASPGTPAARVQTLLAPR